MHARVRVGGKESREVPIRQGVRQGCPLSPTLFNLFVNKLAIRIEASNVGATAARLTIGALLYADDVVLLADNAEDLQKLIDVVDKFCRDWHMEVNLAR
jgi:hypothetical protein